MVRQEVDVLAPVTQRRDMDLDGIQAKQQVLAKSSGGSLRVHIGIRSCKHSHVDAPGRGRSDALKISRFENAQKLGLQIERYVRNLIQEQRAAVREFESPHAICSRVGKCALYVPKQLAFEHAFR